MSRSEEIAAWLPGRLAELVAESGVPGAQAAVLVDGEYVDAAAGVLSLDTGVEVTTDAVFQIGSITKVWTATLVMQLVDDGLLDIDEPIVTYLPEFRVADPRATAAITPRHLLNHTSGVDGDLFHPTGRGDDAVEKYVGTITDAQQVHEPGAMFSYCNTGYTVLGRLVEVLRGKTFGAAVHDHIAKPLGLAHVATNSDEAIMFRAAVGHVDRDGEVVPAPVWSLEPSTAPAGSLLAMRARDLLVWANAHLGGGAPLLSEASAKAMREHQVDVPPIGVLAGGWGLGWELFDHGADVFGHDGGTIGQMAFLRISGAADFAVALLTNSLDGLRIYRGLVEDLLREHAGADVPELPTPPAEPEPLDADLVTGTYLTPLVGFTVGVDEDGRGWVDTTPISDEAKILLKPTRDEFVRLREDAIIGVEEAHGRHQVLALVGRDGQGRAEYLFNGRAAVRTEGEGR
ncbi:CubicO group peptidase (beta-lactamase class C family) [Saccharothrix tamanrassetensis]|uniref:CubicO group peptidase (Beta-lactamase class C family) n=1 Tax=Saccharothrix tamanrassetensis TaxID=1051531 RepID=A0A841CRI6_9PSEU|nr:serine hydrolase domain-containing protein [Saccharothrix tamanrassetensis]MBB5958647.1 CubicO group peptidase (beta-lactamase class C family) [Saccharothrix tamanrassetensis]